MNRKSRYRLRIGFSRIRRNRSEKVKKRKYIILGIVTVLLVAVTVVLAYRMQQENACFRESE